MKTPNWITCVMIAAIALVGCIAVSADEVQSIPPASVLRAKRDAGYDATVQKEYETSIRLISKQLNAGDYAWVEIEHIETQKKLDGYLQPLGYTTECAETGTEFVWNYRVTY